MGVVSPNCFLQFMDAVNQVFPGVFWVLGSSQSAVGWSNILSVFTVTFQGVVLYPTTPVWKQSSGSHPLWKQEKNLFQRLDPNLEVVIPL